MKNYPPPPALKTIGFLCMFFFCICSTATSQTYYLNGRELLKTGEKYYDVTSADSVLIESNVLSIKFQSGVPEQNLMSILEQFPCSLKGKTPGDYYVVNLEDSVNFISFVDSLNANEYVSSTIFSYIINYCDAMNNNDPVANPINQNAWYQGYFDEGGQFPELVYLDLPDAWDFTTGNSSIKVGLIDSGCNWYDPLNPEPKEVDLPEDNQLGINFSTNPPSAYTGPDTTNSVLYNVHGTTMTAVISSRTNNNTDIFGIAGGWSNSGGISPMMIVNRASNANEVSLVNSILGIQYAVDHGARIINLTFGVYPEYLADSTVEQMMKAIDYAIANDVIVVASAGNWLSSWGREDVMFPASYGPVIAVSGVDSEYELYSVVGKGSCWGTGIDFAAPGIEVWTNEGQDPFVPINDNIYKAAGTSFSATIISGVISLMLSANPCLTSNEVFEILKQSCYKGFPQQYQYDTNGWCQEMGYGFINARRAVELSLGMDDVIIQGNITWNKNRHQRGNITIASGGKLKLEDMTLRMAENKKIIVNVGGELEVDSSEITSACISEAGFWDGIVVDGSPTLEQVPFSNQGRVVLSNATISNAKIGIDAWVALDGQQTTGHGGGIIQANNSYFLNNEKSIHFGEYSLPSLSQFVYCRFIINDDFPSGSITADHLFTHIEWIDIVKFKGCDFINQQSCDSCQFKGIGIFACNSNLLIDGVCTADPIVEPCPHNEYEYSKFTGLQYGVQGLNSGETGRTKVNHTYFENNNCGVYLSSVNYADIINNFFFVPGDQDPVDPCGAYIESCTGYHIENNWFEGSPPSNFSDEAGLYIRNSGTAQNYVYNNYFRYLTRGAVADESNRSVDGSTGLCFKCNTFENVNLDIDIQRDIEVDLDSLDGIALNQGSPWISTEEPDTLPAGNIFTECTASYNIRNIANYLYYYFHEVADPWYLKIKPEPVTEETVFRDIVIETTFNRDSICKSWIDQGSPQIELLLNDKDYAESQAADLNDELLLTIDGGNTASLASEIIGSVPSQALELRDNLIIQSPYLSDSVLKTAIETENVLVNSMIRDILVENPQCAKSQEIMEQLDERFDPLPEYMKVEIEEGRNVIGAKEKMIARRDLWLQKEGHLFNRIVSAYLDESEISQSHNELEDFLQSEEAPLALFTLVDMFIARKAYSSASATLDLLANETGLSSNVLIEISGYNSLISILEGLETDSVPLNSIDSLHATPMLALVNMNYRKASIYARNLLIASKFISFKRIVNGSDITKSATLEFGIHSPNNDYPNRQDVYNLYPNPADYYTILEYNDQSDVSPLLVIRDQSGKIVYMKRLRKNQDQAIIETKSFDSGPYSLSIQSKGKVRYSQILIVTH